MHHQGWWGSNDGVVWVWRGAKPDASDRWQREEDADGNVLRFGPSGAPGRSPELTEDRAVALVERALKATIRDRSLKDHLIVSVTPLLRGLERAGAIDRGRCASCSAPAEQCDAYTGPAGPEHVAFCAGRIARATLVKLDCERGTT